MSATELMIRVFEPLKWPCWVRRAMVLTLPIGLLVWMAACTAALLFGFFALWVDIFRGLWKR